MSKQEMRLAEWSERKGETVEYPIDFLGNEIKAGQTVIKVGCKGGMDLRKVSKIVGKAVWLESEYITGRSAKQKDNTSMVVVP